MRKLWIITCCLVGLNMSAQDAKFGIKGGLNYGATGDYETFSDVSGDFTNSCKGETKTGFHAGLFGQFSILGIFIQPEVVYTRLNTDYRDFEYKLDKIDAPVLVGLNILGPLNIKAGPSFQYVLNNDLEKTQLRIGDVQKDITVGYQLGAGLNLGKLGFDVRYEGAFTENTAFSDTANENFKIDSRPSQWILSLAYDL